MPYSTSFIQGSYPGGGGAGYGSGHVNGTKTSGGAGKPSYEVYVGGDGDQYRNTRAAGRGGSLGNAGNGGARADRYYGGGAAGKAIVGNNRIVWNKTGTIHGARINN